MSSGIPAKPTPWNAGMSKTPASSYDWMRPENKKVRTGMTKAAGNYAADTLKYALGADNQVKEILVKFYDFPNESIKPGEGFTFYMEVGEDGAITSDAWYYNKQMDVGDAHYTTAKKVEVESAS